MQQTPLKQHPLRILEQEAPLPNSDLTVILAQQGVGKTAVLINFGLDRLLNGQTVRHFTSSMTSEKTLTYYQEIYSDFSQHYFETDMPKWDALKPKLTIVSYPSAGEMVAQMRDELNTIADHTKHESDLVIVDDLDYFKNVEDHLDELSAISVEYDHPILAGVTVHRDQSGSVRLLEPAEMMKGYVAAIYYMEPDPSHDRIMFDCVKNGKAQALSIFFDPHKFIFRLQ